MTRFKRALIVVMFVVLAGILGLLAVNRSSVAIADDLAAEAFLSIRPGMSEKTLVSLIGQPLEKKSHKNPRRDRWVFADPGVLGFGLSVTVGLRDGRVTGTSVERTDFAVYSCNEQECPKIWDETDYQRLSELIGK